MSTTPAPVVTPQQAFEDKIKAQLRANIGDLLPDEVLGEMVQKAVKDLFFTRQTRSYGYGDRAEPFSWFEEEVQRGLRDVMRKSLTSYFDKHGAEIAKLVGDQIIAEGPRLLGQFLVSALMTHQQGVAQDLADNLASRMERAFSKIGLDE
jgi:hypothetical protein